MHSLVSNTVFTAVFTQNFYEIVTIAMITVG